MSHLAYTRTSWTAGTPLYAAEMADIDAKTFKAINGDDGGTWAPSSVITIGGSGVTSKFVGISTVESEGRLNFLAGTSAHFQSDSVLQADTGSIVNFAGQFYMSAGSNMDSFGDIRIRSAGTLETDSGSNITVNGNAAFNTNVAFNNGFTASGAATLFSSTVSFTGSTRFLGNTIIASPIDVHEKLICSAAGRLVKRVVLLSAVGSNITGYGPNNTDVVIVQSMSAAAEFILDSTNAVDGDTFEIVNKSNTQFLGIERGSGSPISLRNKAENGNYRSIRLIRVGGVWEVLNAELAVSPTASF